MNRRELGEMGEKAAADYLRKRNFCIREANFRCPRGEIDIIAEDKGCLVFIEVRTRSSSGFGTPEESVTTVKKDKLIRLAQTYIQTHQDLPALWRIDVVAVEMSPDGKISRIELIENAVAEATLGS